MAIHQLRDYPRGLIAFPSGKIKIAHDWPRDFVSDHFGANTYESTTTSLKKPKRLALPLWVKSDPESVDDLYVEDLLGRYAA